MKSILKGERRRKLQFPWPVIWFLITLSFGFGHRKIKPITIIPEEG